MVRKNGTNWQSKCATWKKGGQHSKLLPTTFQWCMPVGWKAFTTGISSIMVGHQIPNSIIKKQARCMAWKLQATAKAGYRSRRIRYLLLICVMAISTMVGRRCSRYKRYYPTNTCNRLRHPYFLGKPYDVPRVEIYRQTSIQECFDSRIDSW